MQITFTLWSTTLITRIICIILKKLEDKFTLLDNPRINNVKNVKNIQTISNHKAVLDNPKVVIRCRSQQITYGGFSFALLQN